VKVAVWPTMMMLFPLIAQTGSAFTVSVLLQVDTQPDALETVTV
jgi:hypothetical protein